MTMSDVYLTSDEERDLETLLSKIETSTAVLFLGAGASLGAGAPSAPALTKLLCESFAPDLDQSGGLLDTLDRLQTRKGIDRIDVDAYVAKLLSPLQPVEHHRTISNFAWPAIFTTNYDRLVEKAYDSNGSPSQALEIVRGPSEEYSGLPSSTVALHKLCGCISKLQDKENPLVLSRRDLRSTSAGRAKMLKRLADLNRANTWVFVGYSFSDGIVTDLLADLEGAVGRDFLRWSYAIIPNLSGYDRDFLESYKVRGISLTAEEFFQALARRSNKFQTSLVSRLPSSSALAEMELGARIRLDSQFEYVPDISAADESSTSFYRGNRPTWADLASNLDFPRDQYDALERMSIRFLNSEKEPLESATKTLVITGTAATGKSTLARRLVWNLRNTYQIPLFVAREGVQWEARTIVDASMQFSGPMIVLVDSGEVDFQRVKGLIRSLSVRDVPALVVIAARTGPWVAAQRHWGAIPVDETMEIRERLTTNEAGLLIDKLAEHGFIQFTPVTDRAYWLDRANYAKRIALVVLLELVQEGRFDEIVLSEYQNLALPLAQEAYRTVSTVHEFGIPIKRELLRRMLGCSWDEFLTDVILGEAKKVVIEDFETASEEAYYRSKHSRIAAIVREYTVDSPLATLQEMFGHVDDADRADVMMMRSILKSDELERVLPSPVDRRILFDAAVASAPRDVVIRHQMGIHEMESGNFEDARRIFETCMALSPNNVAVTHSFGLLELEIAQTTSEGPLRDLRYSKAQEHFERVIELDRHSEYGYHSAAALFLNRAKDEPFESERRTKYVSDSLAFADEGLAEIDTREGGRLKALRGQIFELMYQYDDAINEYRQSIEDGSATPNTYYLLARLESERGNQGEASQLVSAGLGIFGDNPRLLLLRAEEALRDSSLSRGQLLTVLGPAVRENPKRLSLIFPFAYLLYETDQIRESQQYFRKSAALSEGVFGRGRNRRMFTGKDGTPLIFEGMIERTQRKGGRIMIRRTDNNDYVYFNMTRALRMGLREKDEVSFQLAFSYLGPIAWEVKRR